ncbi:hypothetical protein [Rhizobium lentis]|uniref:hypothetical protein n=1 Tax=Rhizobium lentis TaxID=1138194 RepID=UPI001C83AD26|nr:hypothetical protein [Rhizobium lentis]MBX5048106.1 hypothetical protein [Rhizobium lentis]MBX5059623.1 hypothetical protein [Rhizobium lentis]
MYSNINDNSQQLLNNDQPDATGDVTANFMGSSPVDPTLAGGFDLTEDDIAEIAAYDEQRQRRRHKAAFEAWQEKHRADIERSRRGGHIAQGLDAIDEHRKTPEGRADYNANRRMKRRKIAEAEGRAINPRKRHETQDESQQAHAAAKRDYKSRKQNEFALLSPDEQQAVRDKEAERKRNKRRENREKAAKALLDKAIF